MGGGLGLVRSQSHLDCSSVVSRGRQRRATGAAATNSGRRMTAKFDPRSSKFIDYDQGYQAENSMTQQLLQSRRTTAAGPSSAPEPASAAAVPVLLPSMVERELGRPARRRGAPENASPSVGSLLKGSYVSLDAERQAQAGRGSRKFAEDTRKLGMQHDGETTLRSLSEMAHAYPRSTAPPLSDKEKAEAERVKRELSQRTHTSSLLHMGPYGTDDLVTLAKRAGW